jgi:hypothetical protein
MVEILSSLQASVISNFKPSRSTWDYAMCPLESGRLRLTSGLHLKSTYLRHVSSRLGDPNSPRTICCLRFTPDDLATEICFGWSDDWDLLWLSISSGFGSLQSQLKTSRTNFSRVIDLLTHTYWWSTIKIYFGYFTSYSSKKIWSCGSCATCLSLTMDIPKLLRLYGVTFLEP